MNKIILKLKTFYNQQLSVPSSYPFVMYEEEKELLKKYVSNTSQCLEFGLGGSTIFTLIHSKAKITSVDTNVNWINFMKKYKIIKTSLSNRLTILYVNIGPTRFWGYPIDNTHQDKFEQFSKRVFEINQGVKYDFILVDGRFRVACVLQSILNQSDNEAVFIGVHDYSIREEYKVVEQFLDIEEVSRTLSIFKIKKNVDLEEVKNMYEKYKNEVD